MHIPTCKRTLVLGLSLFAASLAPLAPAAATELVKGLPDFSALVEHAGPAVVNIRTSERLKAPAGTAQMDEQMVVRQDTLKHTVLKSPVRGLVKNIKANTVGGVVSSGSPIMEIVPLGPRVLIEARIKPRDIGFVQVGQHAVVKLAGYDFNVHGGLEGKVEYISPDALGDTEKGESGAYYRAVVAAERNNMRHPQLRGEPLPIIPGMTAQVEIRTGERSVLSYLLRPMLKSREALRER